MMRQSTWSLILGIFLMTEFILPLQVTGANITLGFTTDMWVGNYYPATALQVALDSIRSQGALLDHNFRYVC